MCQRLIRHRATFIATIGQISSAALNAVRTTQAKRLRTRKRRTRACITEKISSADPHQPTRSSQDIPSGYLRLCVAMGDCVSPLSAARSIASATSTVWVASSIVTMRRSRPSTASRKASSSTSRGSRWGMA